MVLPEVQQMPLALLQCRAQVRKHSGLRDEDISSLAASLVQAGGVVHPLIAWQDGEQMVVLDGERRLRAARLAGFETVPVLVLDHPPSKAEITELSLMLDSTRVNLNPMERACAMQQLMTTAGLSAAAVAKKLGVCEATVSRHLALLGLPEDVQGRIRSGELAPSTAYEIGKVTDPQERDRLVDDTVSHRLSRNRVVHRARQSRRAKPRRPFRRAKTDCVRVMIPTGASGAMSVVGPIIRGEGVCASTLDALVAWFEDVAAKLKQSKAGGLSLDDAVKAISSPNDTAPPPDAAAA